MNTRRTTLLVAILLAVGTGWLTLNYLSSVQRSSAVANQPRPVLIAAQEIPARVTITPQMLQRVTRPAAAVEPDALDDPSKAVGALSLITIPAGAAITSSKIGHPTDVGLPVHLTPGMRAMSIAIDKVKGVSGLIEPGDRVDVIAVPPKQGQEPPPAATILRGVRVLAVGQSLEYRSATPSPDEINSTTVTLEVTPKQADLLAMADLNTTLRLALRSPKEPVDSEPAEALRFPAPMQPQAVAAGNSNGSDTAALALAALARRDAPAARTRSSAPASSVVVIDGDRVVGADPSGP